MQLAAVLFNLSVMAQNVLLHLTTVATGWHTLFARTTRTVVAWPFAAVLSTRHKFSTDITTAPAVFVIGVDAATCH